MLAERRREGFVTRGYPSGPGVGRTWRASRLGPHLSRDRTASRGFRLLKEGLCLQRGALVGKTYLDRCVLSGLGYWGWIGRKTDEASPQAQGLRSGFIRVLLLVGFSS